jgi:nitrogen fixation/metabolism regulation signal transduction histidine kinase
MSTLASNPAPAAPVVSRQRKMRNFLLDARFQLKFAGYVVALTVVIAGLLGGFLYQTTSTLFEETDKAVKALEVAASTSKELGTAVLSNKMMEHVGDSDPKFADQLKAESDAIDKKYEQDMQSVADQRQQLIRRQQITLWALIGGFVAFIAFIALASIVTTHRIVGPLFRVKRMAQEVAAGKLHVPTYGLRPGDELKDLFDAFSGMVKALRQREEDDLRSVSAALKLAEQSKASDDVVRELQTMEAKVKAKLE